MLLLASTPWVSNEVVMMKFKLFLTFKNTCLCCVIVQHPSEDEWDSTFAGIDRIALTHAAFRVDIPLYRFRPLLALETLQLRCSLHTQR